MQLGVADLTSIPGGVAVTGSAFKAILTRDLAWQAAFADARSRCERKD